jgi:hypothetical protein
MHTGDVARQLLIGSEGPRAVLGPEQELYEEVENIRTHEEPEHDHPRRVSVGRDRRLNHDGPPDRTP